MPTKDRAIVTLRLPPPTRRLVGLAAAGKRQSTQAWILAAVGAAILRQAAGRDGHGLRVELERTPLEDSAAR